MLKIDEHEDLCGSGHRSVIPNVHERCLYCCVCVVLFKAEMNLHKVEVALHWHLPGLFIAQCGR
jgi:hypothetical protein